MIKIIDFIITKAEIHLSKKEKCLNNKNTTNEKIKLYRNILDEIDKYKKTQKKLLTFRHYRYFTFEVDDIDEE